ncbi:MAG: DUF3422 domain-containing protein, partial [Pseudomonadota bacterium]
SPRENGAAEEAHLRTLADAFGAPGPESGTNHYVGELGPLRINWERHAEFARYTLISDGPDIVPFQTSLLNQLPVDWLSNVQGEVIAAIELGMLRAALPNQLEAISELYFNGNSVIGSLVSDGTAAAFTDFRISSNDKSKIVVYDLGMSPRQAGRVAQRLLEIETYRMMALLALPHAQALRPYLDSSERELVDLSARMANASADGEPRLLEQLTELEATIQKRQAESHYRLGAAGAYYEIVERRIRELREQRIPGFQTFREFVERRLVPAMSTCRAVSASAAQLSERIARSTALLSTRVEVARQDQNRALLASVARRAKLQLRLQRTVEGLSIAAITYYIVGLFSYVWKALNSAGIDISPDLLTGLSVPLVLLVVGLGVNRVRKWLTFKA